MTLDLTFAFEAPGVIITKSKINSDDEWLITTRLLYTPSMVLLSNSRSIFFFIWLLSHEIIF